MIETSVKIGQSPIVQQMRSKKGNFVPNQFIIENDNTDTFQSYKSIIAVKPKYFTLDDHKLDTILLDEKYWNYSRTTSKYLSIFLNEPIKEIKRKVKEGIYQLTNLN